MGQQRAIQRHGVKTLTGDEPWLSVRRELNEWTLMWLTKCAVDKSSDQTVDVNCTLRGYRHVVQIDRLNQEII